MLPFFYVKKNMTETRMSSTESTISTDTMGQPVPHNDASNDNFTQFMQNAGSRRERDTEITGFVQTGHIFTKDRKGKAVGRCRVFGCNANAQDPTLSRSCVNVVFTPWNMTNQFQKKKDMTAQQLQQYEEWEKANELVYCEWNGKIVRLCTLSDEKKASIVTFSDEGDVLQYNLLSKEAKLAVDKKDEEENQKRKDELRVEIQTQQL